MLRIHPFVMGHLISAVMTGSIAGFFINAEAAFITGVSLAGGAVVSSFVCQWRPGVDAGGGKLWAVAVLANPIMIAALAVMALDWQCVVGARRGWDCVAAAMAIVAACRCLVPPLGGLLWRWWRRRSPAAA